MILDDIYINEAIRIRKEYLYNLIEIIKKEEEIKKYFEQLENIKKRMESLTDTEREINEKDITSVIIEISKNIDNIKKHILPYSDKIKKLDKDQRLLYNNIKDKYPNISNDEIQKQIVPHITPIDDKFRKDNKKLYEKILKDKE